MMNNGARDGLSAGLSIAEDTRNGTTIWALANALRIGSGHVDKRSASQSIAQTATSSTSNTSAVIRSPMAARLDLLSQSRRSPLTRRKSSERGTVANTTGLRPGFLRRHSVFATPLSKENRARKEESTMLPAAATHVPQIALQRRAVQEAKLGTENQVSVYVKEEGGIEGIGGKTFER